MHIYTYIWELTFNIVAILSQAKTFNLYYWEVFILCLWTFVRQMQNYPPQLKTTTNIYMYIYKHKQKNPNQSTNKHQNIKLFFISLKKIQGLLPIVSQHSEHVRLMTQLHISQISQCKGSQAVKETLIPKATLIFLNHETIKSLLIK